MATTKTTAPAASPSKKTIDIGHLIAEVGTVEKVIAKSISANTSAVPIGPSEIASFIVGLGGLCTLFFGHDWGLPLWAQPVGLAVSGAVTIGMAVARAIKHHAVLATVRQIVSGTAAKP